jgi:hypothetical protein
MAKNPQPLFPASRRIDWRRANPCQVAGRVIPGFSRATLRRAGDPQGCTAAGASGGKPTLRRSNLHRVGLPAVVAGNCSSGALQYDSGILPTVHQVLPENGEIAPSDYVLNGVPFPTFCTNLQITVTLDAQFVSGSNGDVLVMGIGAPGFFSLTDVPSPLVFQNSTGVIGLAYTTVTLADSTTTLLFSDFVNPGTALSLYFHAPRRPPSFAGATFNIKNIHFVITAQ